MTLFFRLPDGITLRPFSPHAATRAQWQQLHDYRRLRTQEDYPDEPVPIEADFERQLLVHQPLFESQRIMAVRGDTYVGNLLLGFRRAGSAGFEEFAAFADAMETASLAACFLVTDQLFADNAAYAITAKRIPISEA